MTRRLWAVVVLVLVAGLLPAGPQNRLIPAAATVIINVDSTLDTSDAVPGNGVCDDGGGNCTLRAAVDEANALAGTDTINVPAGTYTLGLSLHPSDDVIVVGAGADTTTLHAEGDIAFWLWDRARHPHGFGFYVHECGWRRLHPDYGRSHFAGRLGRRFGPQRVGLGL